MSGSIEKEIPKRIYQDMMIANYITLNPKCRFILVLTKDLKLFEIKSYEVVNVTDLKDSILKGISLLNYVLKQPSTSQQESDRHPSPSSSMVFGKYVRNLGDSEKKIFILLQGYTKLLVLERTIDNGYKIVQQYENVESFEIIDPKYTFQPLVSIQLTVEPFCIETDFINLDIGKDDNKSMGKNFNTNNEKSFQNLLDRINNAKSELTIHKIRTKKEFHEIKNRLTFGPNLIRSTKLEEKQPLGKYGDVWMRVVNEQLVIGIPIINNCSERLTILHNIRVALICNETQDINFEYTLYQLKNDSYTFENFNELLDNTEEEFYGKISFNDEWLPIKTRTLNPETSGCILIQTKLENFILTKFNIDIICFILYDIKYKHYTFTQQNYLKKIHIETDVMYKDDYQIRMDLKTNDYMDLLAITSTSCFANFHIICDSNCENANSNTITTDEFYAEFKDFIIAKLEFKHLIKTMNDDDNRNYSNTHQNITENQMDIDHQSDEHFDLDSSNFIKSISNLNDDCTNKIDDEIYEIFYNDSKSTNYWYGTLIRVKKNHDKNQINLKIYTRSKDKILAFVKILYSQLNHKFQIIPVCYTTDKIAKNLKLFENCIKTELNLLKNFCNENLEKRKLKRNELYEFQKILYAKELETDIVAMNLN